MRNKTFGSLLVMILIVVFLAVGCSAPEIEVVFKDIPKTPDSEVDSPEVTPADMDEPVEYGEFSMYDETIGQLMISLEETKVIEMLGEPGQTTEPKIWAADGFLHKTSSYDALGVELDYVEINEKFVINTVTAKAPFDGKTSRGIGIGSSEADVMAVYEKDINADEMKDKKDVVIVGSMYGGLLLTMESGVVTAMFLGASAE